VFAVPWCACPCRGEVWASGGETTHQATHPILFLPFPVPLTCPDAPQTTTVHQPQPNPLQVTQARAHAALSRQNWGREGNGDGHHRHAPLQHQPPCQRHYSEGLKYKQKHSKVKDTTVNFLKFCNHAKGSLHQCWFFFLNHLTWKTPNNASLSALLVPSDWRIETANNLGPEGATKVECSKVDRGGERLTIKEWVKVCFILSVIVHVFRNALSQFYLYRVFITHTTASMQLYRKSSLQSPQWANQEQPWGGGRSPLDVQVRRRNCMLNNNHVFIFLTYSIINSIVKF